jgi:ribosome-binding protein aMBF1 (putative translation factor)
MIETTEEDTDSRLESYVDDVPDWFQRDVEMRAELGRVISDAMNEQDLSPEEVAELLNRRTHTPNSCSSLDVEKFMSANAVPNTRDISRFESALDIDLVSVLFDG